MSLSTPSTAPPVTLPPIAIPTSPRPSELRARRPASLPSNELGMVVRTATGLGDADVADLRKIDVGVPARAAQPG